MLMKHIWLVAMYSAVQNAVTFSSFQAVPWDNADLYRLFFFFKAVIKISYRARGRVTLKFQQSTAHTLASHRKENICVHWWVLTSLFNILFNCRILYIRIILSSYLPPTSPTSTSTPTLPNVVCFFFLCPTCFVHILLSVGPFTGACCTIS